MSELYLGRTIYIQVDEKGIVGQFPVAGLASQIAQRRYAAFGMQ